MKLRKIVRDCKEAYTHSRKSDPPTEKSKPQHKPSASSVAPVLGDLSNGNFAEALRKAVGDEDPDVDLNLDGVDAAGVEFGLNAASHAAGNPANSVDLAMLRQPLHLAFLQYGKQAPSTSAAPSVVPSQLNLPVQHSALSRVVVNAIGRLGRWKRVLNYRATGVRAPLRPPIGFGAACLDATSFDIEASETGDLLMVRGGVEQYLKMVEGQMMARRAAGLYRPSKVLEAPPTYEVATRHLSTLSTTETVVSSDTLEPVREASDEGGTAEDEPVAPPELVDPPSSIEELSQSPPPPSHSPPPASVRSSVFSDDSYGEPLAHPTLSALRNDVDVVSIDDMDLSDLSSVEELSTAPAAVGFRRAPRRLPNRRDFEFVRQSVDSVSSMGIRAHDSVLSAGSSVISSAHVSGSADLAGPIQQWQMNALVDSLSDDEEPGDVEAALRRLEGQINEPKQKAKQSKVDGWVQSIRERLANGQFNAERRRYSSDDEEDYGEVTSSMRDTDGETLASDGQGSRSRTSMSQVSSRNSVSSAYSPFAVTHPAEEMKAPAVPPGLGHPQPQSQSQSPPCDGKPAPEDAVPLEILQSRVPSRPTTSAGSPPAEKPPPLPLNHLSMPSGPAGYVSKPEKNLKRHRSFILSYKSETLIQQFSIIDRELFLNLKFEELVSQDNWMTASEEYNILDWNQFQKERQRLRAEEPSSPKASALTAIRCRFNVMANFVIAEIVITHPSERLMVHSKFVRIAWVSLASFIVSAALLTPAIESVCLEELQHVGRDSCRFGQSMGEEGAPAKPREAWSMGKSDAERSSTMDN